MTTTNTTAMQGPSFSDDPADGRALLDLIAAMRARWVLLLAAPLLAGAAALGATYLITPGFTAKTVFLPPQPPQSAAASALASLSSLASLTGAGSSTRSSADQYIGLMQSLTISDHIIDKFDLQKVYDLKLRSRTQKELADNVRLTVGKKDGLISVEVDDTDPKRAADIANNYVEELRRMTSVLAVTEAQQRRLFFEKQLQDSHERLTAAQIAMQSSGFSAGALKAEPKAAADAYAKLKAEATAAEVKLQTLRTYLSDGAAELKQAQSTLSALRGQVARLEQSNAPGSEASSDYVSKYREFKYRETLFDLLARQFESAKIDESREGALIQVVDSALPPDHKSKPKRGILAASVALLVFLGLGIYIATRHAVRRASDALRSR